MSDPQIPWTAAAGLPYTSPSPRVRSNSSIKSVMPSNSFILCRPFLLLSSIFLSIRVFSSESALWHQVAKVLELQLQYQSLQWIFRVDSLRLTGFISLLLKGLSRVFSAPQFESINFSVFSLLYGPTLTSVHDYWKNRSFDYTDISLQSDDSAF